MLAKWKRKPPTPSQTKKLQEKAEEEVSTKGKVHYKGQWLTQQEYRELKQSLNRTWDERVEDEKLRTEKLKNTILVEENIKKTKELIKQGYRKRSEEANRILNEFEDWQSSKTDHFLIFFRNEETGKMTEKVIEERFAKLLGSLNLAPSDLRLESRIDIFLIEDNTIWQTALEGQYSPDSPNHFTKIFRQEVFLNVTQKNKLEDQLAKTAK